MHPPDIPAQGDLDPRAEPCAFALYVGIPTPDPISPPGVLMSNVLPVDHQTQTRVLADFFTRGQTANVPAVHAATLRQAVADRTPDVPTQSGEGGQ